jgi:hypothetical protein
MGSRRERRGEIGGRTDSFFTRWHQTGRENKKEGKAVDE